jgi:hypothetical protein
VQRPPQFPSDRPSGPPEAPPPGPPLAASSNGHVVYPAARTTAAAVASPSTPIAPPPPLEIDADLQQDLRYDEDRSSDLASPIPRRRRSESGSWGLLAGAFGVAALLLGVAVALLVIFRERQTEPVEPNLVSSGGNGAEAVTPTRSAGDAAATDKKFEPSLSKADLEFLRREIIAPYVHFVRSDGDAGLKSATGILADPQGLYAVPLSSVRGADLVVVSSASGSRTERTDAGVESPGAVAVDRECDWLLIAARPLPGAPVVALARSFDKPPKQGDRVIVAGASERGDARAFEAEVREAPAADALSEPMRRALTARGWNVERFDWRLVGPVTESLRPGVVLLSLDGVWLGVVASATPDGEALLVATGPELGSMFGTVGPPTSGFERLEAAAGEDLASDPSIADPSIVGPDATEPGDAASGPSGADVAATGTASGEAPSTELSGSAPFAIDEPKGPDAEDQEWRKAAEELGDIIARVEANGLYAESLEEYLDLSDLAANVTEYGERAAEAPESDGRLAWEAERDRALELLASRPWEKDFVAAAHNELAGKHVDAVKGILLFGEVTAAKDEIAATGGRQPILFQAIGRSDQYVVDMTKNSDEFVKGSKWIVVATADPRMKISLRKSADDSGTLCPILEAKYVIARPGDAAPKKASSVDDSKKADESPEAKDETPADEPEPSDAGAAEVPGDAPVSEPDPAEAMP